jgi:hypothetical protein
LISNRIAPPGFAAAQGECLESFPAAEAGQAPAIRIALAVKLVVCTTGVYVALGGAAWRGVPNPLTSGT